MLYLGCKWKSEGLAFEGKEFIEELERRINGPRRGGEDGTYSTDGAITM